MEFVLQHAGDLAGFLIRLRPGPGVFGVPTFAFRNLFYRRELDRRGRIWYVLFWSIAAILAPKLTVLSAYVPFFAGLFGDVALGGSVGALAALYRIWSGWSIPSAVAHVLAGLAGGAIGRRRPKGRPLPLALAVLAGALSQLGMHAVSSGSVVWPRRSSWAFRSVTWSIRR